MRETVPTDRRRRMTPARKARIWNAWGQRCWLCRQPVPESGPEVIYDHVGTLFITGSDADADIGPIHAAPCNKLKTAADLTRIAKTKRQAHMRLDVERPKPSFPRSKRKLQSRGFDQRHRRRMNGVVGPKETS